MKELEELGRLRREAAKPFMRQVWLTILQALKEAIPAEEPRCVHNFGPGYCPKEDCEFS